MEFNVSTLDTKDQVENLKKTILTSEPNANVSIDLDSKKVTIESEASTETFKQLIVAAGHEVS